VFYSVGAVADQQRSTVFYSSQLELWRLEQGHMQGVSLDKAEGAGLGLFI
jgi:hypothetical protein